MYKQNVFGQTNNKKQCKVVEKIPQYNTARSQSDISHITERAGTNYVISFRYNLINYIVDKIKSLDLLSTHHSPTVVQSTHKPTHSAFLFDSDRRDMLFWRAKSLDLRCKMISNLTVGCSLAKQPSMAFA